MGSTRKPEEIYQMIERFCLGRKRIEIFGETHNIRDGWYKYISLYILNLLHVSLPELKVDSWLLIIGHTF